MNDVTRELLEALKYAAGCLGTDGNDPIDDIIARAEAALAEPQPDADGWIPWAGGECPLAEDALVEIWRRDGVQYVGDDEARPAIRWRWSNCNTLSDIIAYRIVRK